MKTENRAVKGMLVASAVCAWTAGLIFISENTGKKADVTSVAENETVVTDNVPEVAEENNLAADNKKYDGTTEWTDAISTKELRELSNILDKNENTTLKIKLSDLVAEGEIIESFTLYMHSLDGNKEMGTVQYGYGISVDEGCSLSTNKEWYQEREVLSKESPESSCSVDIEIPDEIKEYIKTDSGELLFGYWWGDSEKIVIDSIVCNKKAPVTV